MLTTMPSEANAIVSSAPTNAPDSTASANSPEPMRSAQTYGNEMSSTTGQIESAASNLPMAIWRGGNGVSSNVSSVPRSRSPLRASALTSRLIATPIPSVTCITRLTVSFWSMKFKSLFVAARKVSRLSNTLKARARIGPRQLSQKLRTPARPPQPAGLAIRLAAR